MQTPFRSPALSPVKGLLALSCLLVLTVRAQDSQPLQLDKLVVTGVPVEQSYNPLTRDTSAVMGDTRGPLDTPRAVSTITSGLVNERAIHGLRDILEYAPGAYAPSSYGELTMPYIRGDIAEAYVNGQRRTNNEYGFLPSFNGVEAVDVVRGAGSAVFGAGYLTGGYVNYQTKQPQFSGPATTVTARLGTWAAGGLSFFNGSVQVDSTAPVSDKFAWRISYEGKGGDTFYSRNNDQDDREDIFAAFTWKPHSGLKVDFNAQWMGQNTNETLGVNRVNQDLIDHGLYYSGASLDGGYNPGPIPGTSVVKLARDATLLSKGDYAQAHVANVQLIVTDDISPGFQLVNRTFFEWVNRKRVYESAYNEFVEQHTFENRTEAHFSLDGAVPHSVVAGAALRLQAVRSFENYTNEYLYNFDITNPARVFNQVTQFPNSFFPGYPGPGGLLFFGPLDPYVPTPETGDSRVWNPAVFVQDDAKLGERLHLLTGLRGDGFYARALDPLPPPGVTTIARDTASTRELSGNASLLFRPSRTASYYLTWQSTSSLHGNLGGGGISLQSDGKIDENDLKNRSTLLEAGAKYSFLENKMYAGAALFSQRRSRTGLGDVHQDIRVRGLELETVYQPDTHLSLTFNATIQDGKYLNAAPFQLGGRDIYATYLAGHGPGGRGTGDASFSPWDNQVPKGDWPLVGFSKLMFNASARYRFANGFGLGLDGQWGSRQRGNLDDQWHIPAQYTLNASLSWQHGPWQVNLDILNLTDQRNWIHNGDAYTSSILVLPELPLRAEAYVKFRF